MAGLFARTCRRPTWRKASRDAGPQALRTSQADREDGIVSGYRIESDVELSSDWLPAEAFRQVYRDRAAAVATAIEGVDDPEVQEVRVVDVVTGGVVWRSTEEQWEDGEELGWP
jgi:hypothetical protein